MVSTGRNFANQYGGLFKRSHPSGEWNRVAPDQLNGMGFIEVQRDLKMFTYDVSEGPMGKPYVNVHVKNFGAQLQNRLLIQVVLICRRYCFRRSFVFNLSQLALSQQF